MAIIYIYIYIYIYINYRLNCLIYLEVESFEFILLLLGSFFMSVNLPFLLFLLLLLFFHYFYLHFFTDTLVIRRLRSWPLRIHAQHNDFRTSLYRALLVKFDW